MVLLVFVTIDFMRSKILSLANHVITLVCIAQDHKAQIAINAFPQIRDYTISMHLHVLVGMDSMMMAHRFVSHAMFRV